MKGKEETADEVALDPSPPRTRSYTNTKAAEEVRKPIRQPAGKSRKPSDREKAADERTAADDAPDAGREQAAEEGDETAAAPADAATAPLGAECALLPPVKDFYELQVSSFDLCYSCDVPLGALSWGDHLSSDSHKDLAREQLPRCL